MRTTALLLLMTFASLFFNFDFEICAYCSQEVLSMQGQAQGEDKPSSTDGLTTMTVDTIIERYIEEVGGRAALEALRSRSCKGRFEEFLGYKDPPEKIYPLEAHALLFGKWSLQVRHLDVFWEEGSDGSGSWWRNTEKIVNHPASYRPAMAFCLDPQGPLRFDRYFPGMVYKGVAPFEGNDCHVVEATGIEQGGNILYFDVETGLLVNICSHERVKKYMEVEGVKVPSRLSANRKGGYTDYVFTEITHNEPVDTKLFVKPDKPAGHAPVFLGISDPVVLPMLKKLQNMRGRMNVPAQDGRLLYDLVVKQGFKRGLEIGTSNGYSTLWLGLAFRETGGKVITIEYNEEAGAEAKKNFAKAGLTKEVDLRINDAFKEIPELDGEFDFVFIDAWKPDYVRFLKLIKDRVPSGGIIAAHNVSSHDESMKPFLDAVKNDPQLETSFHRISRAGVSVSIKK